MLEKPRDSSIHDSGWSKEAVFALLGVLVVVLVPCIAFLAKLLVSTLISRYFRPQRRQNNGTFRSRLWRLVVANDCVEDIELAQLASPQLLKVRAPERRRSRSNRYRRRGRAVLYIL